MDYSSPEFLKWRDGFQQKEDAIVAIDLIAYHLQYHCFPSGD